jgi:nucleobase:cation symporter-1, NCS1 family
MTQKEIAVTEHDFEELNEDVSRSPLWNQDLAPTSIKERTWTTWNIAALWIGMSVVITTYTLAGGFIEAGMNWRQAMLTILLGNTIVLVPMILNAHAGTKYGVSFPVLCRASFGTRGANVPAILRAIVACGWFGIQTWIGGQAIDALLGAVWPGWMNFDAMIAGNPLHLWISFFIFWLIQVVIILKGIEGIKYLESWSAPLLLAGGLILLIWAISKAGGLGNVLSGSAALQKQSNDFWTIFPGALTASVGYWATLSLNIPDFTRYAKSQKSQMLGQALGLPLTMTAFAFIGVAVTSATVIIYGAAIPDPVELIKRFDSAVVILLAMVVIFIAQLTTNMAANVVSPSNDFSNLNPKLISYVTGGLITAVIGILMMPWQLIGSMGAYIFTWLIGYSGLMGAIGGIMICDYFLLRKRKLNLAALFKTDGIYSYGGSGFNWRAIVALVLGILPVVPGFLRAATTPGGQAANPNFFDTLYVYAWFVTFGIGFALYFVLMKAAPPPPPPAEENSAADSRG